MILVGVMILNCTGIWGCGGGGGEDFRIISFNPPSAPPGKLINAECSGVSENTSGLKLSFGDLQLPIAAYGDDWVKFYVPPITAGAYQIILTKNSLTTPEVTFNVKAIADLPYTQVEFAGVIDDGLKSLGEIADGLIEDLDAKADLYSNEEMTEIAGALNDLYMICSMIEQDISQLPSGEAQMLQSMFKESGVLQAFVQYRETAQRIAQMQRDAAVIQPVHLTLFWSDTLSSLITNNKVLIDLGLIAGNIIVAIKTGGTGSPLALKVSLEVKLGLILTDYFLDTIIPTDLHKIEIKNLSQEMALGTSATPAFIGHFKCQDNVLGSSMDLFIDKVFAIAGVEVFKVPDSLKAQIKQDIIKQLVSLGIKTGEQVLGDMLEACAEDRPLFTDFQTDLDMNLYNNYDYNAALGGIFQTAVNHIISAINTLFSMIGWEFVIADSVVIQDKSGLSFEYVPGLLKANKIGHNQIKARGTAKIPKTELWVLHLELDQVVESNWRIVNVTEHADEWPVWDGTVGIKAANAGDGEITVTFGTATDPQGDNPVMYRLYGVDETATTSQNPFGTSGFHVDNITSPCTRKFENGHQWWLAVRAVDSKGNEDPNTNKIPAIPGVQHPIWDWPYEGIKDVVPGDGHVWVTFGTATDPQGDIPVTYNLYIVDQTATGSQNPFGGSGHSVKNIVSPYQKTSLINGHTYWFGVRAQDSKGNEDENGNKLYAVPVGQVQQYPVWDTTVGITNVTPGVGQATVYYGTATDPQGDPVQYNVYYVDSINSTDPFNGTGHIKVANAGSSPCVINGLTLEHTYYFGVRANDGKGHEEGNSNVLSAYILPTGTEPHIIKTVDTPGYADGVAISGGYAYVADHGAGLQIIDVKPAESACIVKTVPTSFAVDVAISGGYAYVADSDAGLRIIDVEPPESAYIVKTVDTPYDAFDVAVSGGYAYVADGLGGLRIIDVEPPESAYIVNTVDTPEMAEGIAVSAGYAYVADGFGGLQIIDVEPPESAYIVKPLAEGLTNQIAVLDGYAYCSTLCPLIYIVDIEPINSAYVVKTVDTPWNALDVAVSVEYAYVADGLAGLQIIDIEPIESAYIVKAVDTIYGQCVAISDGFAYVTGGTDGLHLIDLEGYY